MTHRSHRRKGQVPAFLPFYKGLTRVGSTAGPNEWRGRQPSGRFPLFTGQGIRSVNCPARVVILQAADKLREIR